MARYTFGGEAVDLVITPDATNQNALIVAASTVIPMFAAEAGTQVTDFMVWSGGAYVPATQITTTTGGHIPRMQGPDGLSTLWLQDGAGGWVQLRSWETSTLIDAEQVRDVMGTALIGSGLITVTPSDVGDTITVSTAATANSSDAQLRDRATHTGEVPIASQVSDWSNTAPANGQVPQYVSSTGLWTPTTPAPTADFATRSGSVSQFADWSDAVPGDGGTPVYDVTSNTYIPVDLSTQYAQVDGDGRIIATAQPKFYVPIVIINEGGLPPTDFPVNGIVGVRPAAPSLIPTLLVANSAINSTTVTLTTPEALQVGDRIGLVVGASGEATFPATFTLSYATGAGAVALHVTAQQSGSAQANIFEGTITTLVPASTVLTVTSAANARQHFIASLFRMPGLSSSPIDKTAVAAANSSSNLNLTVGPTSTATSQANELGIMGILFNAGGTAADRTIAGTGGWQQITNIETVAGTTSRILLVAYRVLTTVGQPSGTATITASDGASGAYAGALATFRAA